jgi:monofunctional biosynthetic peptidoglycan transglycosylase
VSRKRRRGLGRVGQVAAAASAAMFAYGAFVYVTLPDVRDLKLRNPDSTAFIELRAQEARARGEVPKRSQRWVTYGHISPNLTRAVLVAEDDRFWKHEGIDFDELKESMEINIERMEFARGGSTITQQLAKNLYLSPSKNPIRKVREFMIARALEAELSKQRILELYLNVVEWGDGIYGAEAAARAYFHKSAADLAPQDAALLAAALVNPRLLDPAHPTARLKRRQQMVLHRMGAVMPPPVLAGPVPPPPAIQGPEPVPELPVDSTPAALPGEAVPVSDDAPKSPGTPNLP